MKIEGQCNILFLHNIWTHEQSHFNILIYWTIVNRVPRANAPKNTRQSACVFALEKHNNARAKILEM